MSVSASSAETTPAHRWIPHSDVRSELAFVDADLLAGCDGSDNGCKLGDSCGELSSDGILAESARCCLERRLIVAVAEIGRNWRRVSRGESLEESLSRRRILSRRVF
jgi:hypothetical protein